MSAYAENKLTRLPIRHGQQDHAKTPVRVADQLVAALVRHGVDRVFGIPGGTISPVFDALIDSNIEVVTCQHETMAVYAACGYARATGRPAVVAVTSGPGVLNAITGVSAAYMDEAPVLVLAGEVATGNTGRGPLQDGGSAGLDVATMYRPVTKTSETLWQPQRAGAMIEQSLATIMQHPRGPGFLRLPVNVAQTATIPTNVVRTFTRPADPDLGECEHIASLLDEARRPAIMLGVGARQTAAGASVLALAEWLRCPVLTDIEAKGVFPESHPLSLGMFGVGSHGPAARYLEEGVDLLVTVGCRLDDTTTSGFSTDLRPDGILVQIDHDQARLCRSYQADVAMECDIVAAVQHIHAMLPTPSANTLLARDHALQQARNSTLPVEIPTLGEPPHDPRAVAAALQRAFGPDTVFTSDIGNHLLFTAQTLRIDRPDAFYVALGLGGMTSGIGAAIGLQAAYGQTRQVVGICGDGGFLMGGNELATCAKYNIPVVIAVFNDGQLGMVQHGDDRVFGRCGGWNIHEVDLESYARGLGIDFCRLNSLADLAWVADVTRTGPLLLDIPIDPAARSPNPREHTVNYTNGQG